MSALIAASTVTLNAAFLQEIKQANGEFWATLSKAQYACERPILGRHGWRCILDVLMQLEDQFAMYIALEEAYGFFDDPVESSPSTSLEVERMRSEHVSLYGSLSNLVESSEIMFEEGNQALLTTYLPESFAAFHDELLVHEHRENELLLSLLDQDTGTGD